MQSAAIFVFLSTVCLEIVGFSFLLLFKQKIVSHFIRIWTRQVAKGVAELAFRFCLVGGVNI